jgi:hypothetical protein
VTVQRSEPGLEERIGHDPYPVDLQEDGRMSDETERRAGRGHGGSVVRAA